MSSSTRYTIEVGARGSPLSRVQIEEVLGELRSFHPEIDFQEVFVQTTGDKDLKTSLRTLDKTDFFTKEIDALQLSGGCRISIHSAKDLPEPLPRGLVMAALTQGVDPSDVLVLREGTALETLPPGARIGTSSLRREKNIRELRADLICVDIRGTIGMRLALLDQGEVDGLVMAEAALIRLQLTHLNRVLLPGDGAPLQGQLVVLAREEDKEMLELFAPIDTSGLSQKSLPLGPRESPGVEIPASGAYVSKYGPTCGNSTAGALTRSQCKGFLGKTTRKKA